MLRKTKLIFASFLILFSCSSVKKASDIKLSENFPVRKPGLGNLELNCKINANMDGFSQSVNSNILAKGIDSISMEIIGPLGIPVGKLFAKKESFFFYSTFENTLYTGSPNAENMKRAVNLPLSFYDFIRLLRIETPGEAEDFIVDADYEGSEGILYKNDNNDDYIEYVLVSAEDKTISQYQRKDMDGEIIIDVLFKDYSIIDSFAFPANVKYRFPLINTNLTIEYEDVIPNANIEKPLSFKVPSGVKKIKLD